MSQEVGRGSKSKFAWKPEKAVAGYGINPGGNFNYVTFSADTFSNTINEIKSDEMRSDRSTPSVRGGNIQTGGSITTDFSLTRFGGWLAHLLGQTPTTTTITVPAAANTTAYIVGDIVSANSKKYLCITAGTTGAAVATDLTGSTLGTRITSGTAEFVYICPSATAVLSHVLTPSVDYPVNGLHFEKAILGQDTPFYVIYAGGRMNSLSLTLAQEGIAKAAWDLLFAGRSAGSSSSVAGTPVDIVEDPAVGYECQIQIDGVTSAIMKDASLSINNNCEADLFVMGSRYRRTIPPGSRTITGTLNALFDSQANYDRFIAESEFTLRFILQHGNAYMEILLPETKMFGDPVPKITGPGALMSAINFTSFRQDSAADIQITMKNLVTGYGADFVTP